VLDLHAASRPLDRHLHAFLVDDDQRWRVGDAAALGEIGPHLVVDPKYAEGVVVVAPLQVASNPLSVRRFAAEPGGLKPWRRVPQRYGHNRLLAVHESSAHDKQRAQQDDHETAPVCGV
jgi:hypothetical protein